MAWAIWLTGLPGSGKSTIAKALVKKLGKKKKIQILRMDEFRKFLTPKPKYTEEEREVAYRAMVLMGYYLVQNGINVIFDATAHRQKYRDFARDLIENFYEVHVKCDLKTAMHRESKRKGHPAVRNMYKKALKRQKGKNIRQIGHVIGIDVPYETPKNPHLEINTEKISAKEAAGRIVKMLT